MDIERAIEHYAVFSGCEQNVKLCFSDSLDISLQRNLLDRYDFFKKRYILSICNKPNQVRLLRAVAMSDGIMINVYRRAGLSRKDGFKASAPLLKSNILYKERSREQLLVLPPKQKRKKALRRYTIWPKIKFVHPFYRFWYTFITPHAKDIEVGNYESFFEHLHNDFGRYVSFVFEDLSNALLKEIFKTKDPLVEQGNYWDRYNEFDLLARTKSDQIIIGECKWKRSRICKSIVTKLKTKCERSDIHPDIYALFSKSGFSNELKNSDNPTLLCFDLKDFERHLS